MSNELEGDERYLITNESDGIIHKADLKGKPDFNGAEYHIIEEMGDGYMIYMKTVDPSQPSPNYFIHKKYILNQPKKSD